MEKKLKEQLYSATRTLLQPIASLLLNCGLTWREFSELSKSVFVDVASREFGTRGRPTNISRVSILTGISRKEVKRQRELLLEAGEAPIKKTTDATRVLSGWHQDPQFLDLEGRPLDLGTVGDGASFATLMKRYGGDIPPAAMLKALISAGAVVETRNGYLRAKLRYYMPQQLDTDWVRLAGDVLQELAATLNHNLMSDDTRPARFQGRATSDGIDPAAMAQFREMLDQEGQQFLERVDDWLTEHRLETGDDDGARTVRLGVGLYAIEGKNDNTRILGRKA